jgi:hypothetical protein
VPSLNDLLDVRQVQVRRVGVEAPGFGARDGEVHELCSETTALSAISHQIRIEILFDPIYIQWISVRIRRYHLGLLART